MRSDFILRYNKTTYRYHPDYFTELRVCGVSHQIRKCYLVYIGIIDITFVIIPLVLLQIKYIKSKDSFVLFIRIKY